MSTLDEKKKIEICIFNLMILLYLFRTSIPFLKYPFLVIYIGFSIYAIVKHGDRVVSTIHDYFKDYLLVIILALLLVFSFFSSSKVYLVVFKDNINMLILLSLFYFGALIIESKMELSFFVRSLLHLIVLLAFFVSIFGILGLLDIVSYTNFSEIDSTGNITKGETISIDYNFALLPLFFGLISIFYFLIYTDSKFKKYYYNFIIVIFSLDIIISGSRRGFLLLLIIFMLLLSFKLITTFRKNQLINRISSNSNIFLLSLIAIPLFLSLFFLKTSYHFKNRTLEIIGTKNIMIAKTRISLNLFRYISAINKNATYTEINRKVWTIGFDPLDPDSGWGSRIHKTVFPLTGRNVEIVPSGVSGYYMDKSCDPSYYAHDNLSESYTQVADLVLSSGDKYYGSVFCYVSEDFNGSTVSFGNMLSYIYDGTVSGRPNVFYDLRTKGIWKKLEIEFDCKNGLTSLVLSFTKSGAKDFSNLTGYVIFAYPQYQRLSKVLNEGENKKINTINPSLKDFSVTKHMSLQYSSFILSIADLPKSLLAGSEIIQKDTDPIRIWASHLISEDTTYYPYKSDLGSDKILNPFIDDRILRWEMALKIYFQEYSLREKAFGGGFDYLNWYGKIFYGNKTKSDYPHNPFLSVLLYSGFFGLIIYLIFIYKVFYYYIKYFKEYKILAVFFIITFFFSFFSAGNPFDPPTMGFFVILPFFIHSIHKKDKTELIDNQ